MNAVRDLIEREVCFNYGYNMTCANCGGITTLTSTDYYLEPNNAHVRCVHCEGDIHFGPAVMALRNPDDPVLRDQQARSVAWYHTSTDPGWPGSDHLMPTSAIRIITRTMPDEAVQRVRDRYETQALHLGTYETAIESMLRKMRDEDAGGAQFWLYRVALRGDGTRIKPGYWNENEENISQITQEELGDWDVIRYLNTWESPGSISLAVRHQSLAAVQGIRLPVQALSSGAAPSLVREIARIRDHISQIEATRQDEPDQMERFSQRMAARHGASLPREPTPEQQDLDASISKLIEDEYLPGISLPVREKFSNAMLAWRQSREMEPDDISFIERFALMATALTRPGDIHQALDAEVPRML
jgi:hypothetical protein